MLFAVRFSTSQGNLLEVWMHKTKLGSNNLNYSNNSNFVDLIIMNNANCGARNASLSLEYGFINEKLKIAI